MYSDRELNNLPFESAGIAGATRVDPLENIQSSISLIKQERRHAYRSKRHVRLISPEFKCGVLAVEPQSITSHSFGFTDCESASSDSDLTDNYLVTSSKERGITD